MQREKRCILIALVLTLLLPSSVFAEVKDKPVAKMEIEKMPDRIVYDMGESVDLYGIRVKVTFTDGEEYYPSYTDFQCLGFVPSQVGSQLIVLQYGDAASTPFAVTVQRGTTRGIEASLVKKNIWIGGTKLSSDDFIVNAIQDTGSKRQVTEFEFEPKVLQSGRNTITVTYGEHKTVLSMEAKENTCQSIRIETPGVSEFTAGELFRWTGLKVIAHYLDGTEEDVTTACRVTGVNTGKVGEYYAEVTYRDKKVTYPVKVINLTYSSMDVSTWDTDKTVALKFYEKTEPVIVTEENVRVEDDYATQTRTFYVTLGERTYTREAEIPDAEKRYIGSNRVLVEVPIGITIKTNTEGVTGYIPETTLQCKGESGVTVRVLNTVPNVEGLPITVTIPRLGQTSFALNLLQEKIADERQEVFYPLNVKLEVD